MRTEYLAMNFPLLGGARGGLKLTQSNIFIFNTPLNPLFQEVISSKNQSF